MQQISRDRRKSTLILAVAAAQMTFGPALTAQTQGGAVSLFGVSVDLQHQTNPDLDDATDDAETLARALLNYAFSSQTRSQSFDFGLSGALVTDGDETDLADPSARLSYGTQSANSAVSFSARTETKDVERLLFTSIEELIETEGDELGSGSVGGILIQGNTSGTSDLDLSSLFVVTEGQRTESALRFGFQTGREGPAGFSFSAGHENITYSDIDVADLFDTRRTSASADARLDLRPNVEASVSLGWSGFEADDADQSERRTTETGFGLSVELARAVEVSTRLSFDQVETDSLSDGRATREGISFGLSVDGDLPAGTYSAAVNSNVTANGQRNTVSLGRSFDLPTGGLSVSLGGTWSEAANPATVATLMYSRQMRNSEFSLEVNREVRTNSQNDEVLVSQADASFRTVPSQTSSFFVGLTATDRVVRQGDGADSTATGLQLRYTQQLSPLANASAGLSLSAVSSDEDQRRADLDLGLQRRLTDDWGLSMTYQLTSARTDATGQATSNSVSLGLSRSFTSQR